MATGTLAGQVALVTGGGTGLGFACARAIHADGATVILTGRRAPVLDTAVAALGERAIGIVADVTIEHDMRACVFQAQELGRLTMSVANAGFGSAAPLLQTSLDQWQSGLHTNLTGHHLRRGPDITPAIALGFGVEAAAGRVRP